MKKSAKRSRGWIYTVWSNKREDFATDLLEACKADDKIEYAVFGHEICPDTGTEHLQGFVYWTNAVTGRGAQRRLGLRYGEYHAEAQRGTHAQASKYCEKEENLAFVHGEIPDPDVTPESAWDYILIMIEDGASDFEIMKTYPAHFARCKKGITAMRAELAFQNVGEYRDIEVTYLWGPTGTGKTRSVLESAEHPRDVYKVTDYKHPFDNYRGQKTILFDEFRSSLKLEHMLNYIDGYVVELPCRYHNKVSQWDKVVIASNLPFEEQYPSFQKKEGDWLTEISVGKRQSYEAWVRRIDAQVHMGHQEGNNSPLGAEAALAHQAQLADKFRDRVEATSEMLGRPPESHIEWQQGLEQSESTV